MPWLCGCNDLPHKFELEDFLQRAFRVSTSDYFQELASAQVPGSKLIFAVILRRMSDYFSVFLKTHCSDFASLRYLPDD